MKYQKVFSSDEWFDSRVASIMRWMWVLNNHNIIAWRDECTSMFKGKKDYTYSISSDLNRRVGIPNHDLKG